MTAEDREQISALVSQATERIRAAYAERFGGDSARAQRLFDRALVTTEDLVAEGFVDRALYDDELAGACLDRETATDPHRRAHAVVTSARYRALIGRAEAFRRPSRECVAVVHVHGTISDAPARTSPATDVAGVLRRLRDDHRVLGVVLWVDSPGGSATASERIARELSRLRETKRVVALFGDVAASGGYYVAANADAIVASPMTVTGSIGVVSARPVIGRALEHLRVRREVVEGAPHADLYARTDRLAADERARVAHLIDAFYARFVDVVAAGRRKDKADVERVARGRVWSGVDAHARGLVDELGGLRDALALLAARCDRGFDPRTVRLSFERDAGPRTWLEPPAALATWIAPLEGVTALLAADGPLCLEVRIGELR